MANTTERVVLITGANRGIGFKTAQQQVRRSPRQSGSRLLSVE